MRRSVIDRVLDHLCTNTRLVTACVAVIACVWVLGFVLSVFLCR